MALIKCEECKKEVSREAKVCVYCGYPIERMAVYKAIEEGKAKGLIIQKKAFNIAGFSLIIGGSVRLLSNEKDPLMIVVSICAILVGILFIYVCRKTNQKPSESKEIAKAKHDRIVEIEKRKIEYMLHEKEIHIEEGNKFLQDKKLEGLISKIKYIEEQYKKTGTYEYKNTLVDNLIKTLSIIGFLLVILVITSVTITYGITELSSTIAMLIIICLPTVLLVKFLNKRIPKIPSIKLVNLKKDYITFQLSDKTEEKYNINDISIKYRIITRFTGKTVVSNFHFLIIGENFEKWISSAVAKNIEYQALVYFIYYLKSNELDNIDNLDTDFLRC